MLKVVLLFFFLCGLQMCANFACATTLDESGNAIIVWREACSTSRRNGIILGGYLAARAEHLTFVQTLSDAKEDSCNPLLSVMPNGDAITVWLGDEGDWGVSCIYYCYFDAKRGWQTTGVLTNQTENVTSINQLKMNTSGEIIVTWNSYIQKQNYLSVRYATAKFGGTWSPPQTATIN